MTKEKTEQAVETEVKAAAVEEAKKDEVKANPLEHTIDLTISAAEVQKLADTQLKRYAKNARMPGFRRGHVPMAQVRAMYGLQAFEEAVNEKVKSILAALWTQIANRFIMQVESRAVDSSF